MTDPNHIAEARKKLSRPQIREVFMRNGARIEPGRDDLPDYVYESVFELLELAAPAVQGEPVAYISHTSEGDILGWERQFDAPSHTPLTAAQQEGVPEETINAVISLVKDAAAAHLNSEFNSCLSKIRKLLTAAHRKQQEGQP